MLLFGGEGQLSSKCWFMDPVSFSLMALLCSACNFQVFYTHLLQAKRDGKGMKDFFESHKESGLEVTHTTSA